MSCRRTLDAAKLIAVCGLFLSACEAPLIDSFIDFSAPGVPGRLFVPDQATLGPRPVILFLHGVGEVGTNNTSQLNSNINNLYREALNRGAFIYAPQATTYGWSNTTRTDTVMSMIDEVFATQNADANRLYVTGVSMGGGGTWTMASRYDEFAAAVPIAGVGPAIDFDAVRMTEMPTWAFHARDDSVVPAVISQNVVNQILTAADEPMLSFPGLADPDFEFASGAIDLQYTEWATGGHGIWGTVFRSEPIYDWMFSRAIPEPRVGIFCGLAFIACLAAQARTVVARIQAIRSRHLPNDRPLTQRRHHLVHDAQ